MLGVVGAVVFTVEHPIFIAVAVHREAATDTRPALVRISRTGILAIRDPVFVAVRVAAALGVGSGVFLRAEGRSAQERQHTNHEREKPETHAAVLTEHALDGPVHGNEAHRAVGSDQPPAKRLARREPTAQQRQ